MQSVTTINGSTLELKPCSHPLLVTAHETVQNILEHVGKKAAVQRCNLFHIIESTWIVVEHQWPQGNEGQWFILPTCIRHVQDDTAFVVTRDILSNSSTDLEFFKVNDIASLLLVPIRNPKVPSITIGFLSFTSNVPREWTPGDKVLLELARDLVSTTLCHPDIFINLDHEIVHLSATEVHARLSNEQHATVDQIVVLFEKIRRQSKIKDLWMSFGMSAFKNKLARFIISNQTIVMALPAFPFKSRNTNSNVIGTLPDMGEVLALANLNLFALQVSEVYPPGCKILVVSDGRVFNDLYPVSDVTVSVYTRYIHSLGQGQLQFIGLDQMFSSSTENQFKRDAIVQLYGGNVETVNRKLKEDAHFHQVYIAFKIHLRKDIGELRRPAAEKAKIMMIRNDSYSELVRLLFPHHVRLSIHDHSSAEKISVHLVGDSIITPWHGVAMKQKDGTWTITRKKTALEMGCVLEDAMSSTSREDILCNDLKSLNITQNQFFSSLPFYREI
ncbi:unnamed protein product [Rotaria socialis]|uniref:GAF domain-containing protein n=1 Tax=Rotaria socialis TaxID=392032 RepID=A0A818BP10_9BILA|nr:unnamed protein product [Rotaria socialis]CAF3418928.1 unnamed protein product [Rotaria socialis]CAF3448459.1 unnamed protein product [Rotaria socialis]CAF3521515.1 unnamed protein product [Rotaria socialis]